MRGCAHVLFQELVLGMGVSRRKPRRLMPQSARVTAGRRLPTSRAKEAARQPFSVPAARRLGAACIRFISFMQRSISIFRDVPANGAFAPPATVSFPDLPKTRTRNAEFMASGSAQNVRAETACFPRPDASGLRAPAQSSLPRKFLALEQLVRAPVKTGSPRRGRPAACYAHQFDTRLRCWSMT